MCRRRIVDRRADAGSAVRISARGVCAVVAVLTAVALVALAGDLLDGREPSGGLGTAVGVAHHSGHVVAVEDANGVRFAFLSGGLLSGRLEASLALLAVGASVGLSADAVAVLVLVELWKCIWIILWFRPNVLVDITNL